jgi:hypothetical protein
LKMAELRKGNIIWKNNLLPNSPENPVHIQDVNSDSAKERLDLLATESKLEQVRVLLAGVATEAKLEQARVLLNTISTKDFATQTTLAAVLAKLGQLETEIQAVKANQLSGDQKVTLSAEIEALLQGFATEGKLEQVRALLAGTATEDTLEQARILLASLDGKDYATQATLAAVLAKLGQLETEIQAVKANQLSGDQKVTLSGTNMEHYGATIDQRPPAGDVPVGAIYLAVNTEEMWQSNGFEWVVLV